MSGPDERGLDLPPTLQSIGRSLRLAYRAEPRLLILTFVLLMSQSLPEALTALWLKLLADGVTADRPRSVVIAIIGLGFAVAGRWVLRSFGERMHLTFRERAAVAIHGHLASLQASIKGVEHHERPAYLDRLQAMRGDIGALRDMYESIIGAVRNVLRLVITISLLVSVHPALVALAPIAVPAATIGSWRARAQRVAVERAAPSKRLLQHLMQTGTTAGPAKELRVTRAVPALIDRHERAWEVGFRYEQAERWQTAAWQAATWALFGAGYIAALTVTATRPDASPGDVLLVLAAGASLAGDLGGALGMGSFMRRSVDAARRLTWLEDYAAVNADHADAPAPARLNDGVRFEGVSFCYPGAEAPVLTDVDLHLPAGSVVALVGENGAGKTTLVKLLCRFYEPTAGRITVDGTNLARLRVREWRARVAATMQDFMRYEFLTRRVIGLGDLPRADDASAIDTAVERGGASDVIHRLPQGLDTQLGPRWAAGTDLSYGQWQKLALSRGLMRDAPLLLVLDEPTAAIDAETEHALFERFAAQAHDARDGRVTVLVSHRFSTVRMADHIVVIDGGRVVETGSHADLMARGGLYAELYELQATGYR